MSELYQWNVVNFVLQKFFIGQINFLSIMLPGALLTFQRMGELVTVVLWGV